jgi:hypothetical protein
LYIIRNKQVALYSFLDPVRQKPTHPKAGAKGQNKHHDDHQRLSGLFVSLVLLIHSRVRGNPAFWAV